jgi:hypothetical protein
MPILIRILYILLSAPSYLFDELLFVHHNFRREYSSEPMNPGPFFYHIVAGTSNSVPPEELGLRVSKSVG